MRHAQILAYGLENRLMDQLRPWTENRGLWFRPTRHGTACLNLLRQGSQGPLILKMGRDLEAEFSLLEKVSTFFPDIPTVVIGEADHPSLINLAWDLGASSVLLPLSSLTELQDTLLPWLPEAQISP